MGVGSKTREKVGNFSGLFLSVSQAAEILGIDPKTVKAWCGSGKLTAMAKPYGKTITYQINKQALELFLLQQEKTEHVSKSQKKQAKPHQEYIEPWRQAMATGTLAGKAYSPRTIDDYMSYGKCFFESQNALTIKACQQELMKVPVEQFAKREHYYKALLCLGKFLCSQDALEDSFLDDVKPLRPKRHIPPKRLTVDEAGLGKMLDVCKSMQDRLIVTLLSSTGLRASEACALTWGDIDLNKGFLIVQCGKGGKRRPVGINSQLSEVLSAQMSLTEGRTASGRVLMNRDGNPMSRYGLRDRLKRIGRQAGIQAIPHALRRAFVTINANKGRPLVILQRSCGHSDIKTTMSYCLTAEQEVIDAMKEWD